MLRLLLRPIILQCRKSSYTRPKLPIKSKLATWYLQRKLSGSKKNKPSDLQPKPSWQLKDEDFIIRKVPIIKFVKVPDGSTKDELAGIAEPKLGVLKIPSYSEEYYAKVQSLTTKNTNPRKTQTGSLPADVPFDLEDIKIKEPMALFRNWYEEALQSSINQPEVFALATANLKGQPSCRMFSMKEYNKNGFQFLVDSESRKGYEMRVNPKAAMTFHWREMKRCVRIEGTLIKLSAKEKQGYYKALSYDSQVLKMTSKQSSPIQSRDFIIQKCIEIKKKFPKPEDLKIPENYVGYRLQPTCIEFWQGRHDGIHDRIRFRKPCTYEDLGQELVKQGEDGWFYERIAP